MLEEQRSRKAKNSLVAYVKYIDVPGAPLNEKDPNCEEFYPESLIPAQHHKLLLERLEDVASGVIKRLMILMPPGSAKSTYASVVFPTWYMGKFPKKNIIEVTYGSDLAKKFGRKCRQVVRSKQYKEIFNTELSGDNAAADDWSLTNGSTYMCGGILSGITGNRADGLIIDDPFKNREEADSKVVRDKTREEYISSCLSRLKPNGFQIIINTRWNEDDLSGGILPDKYNGESGWITAKDGAEWYVLCIQAESERLDDPLGRKKGEFLWTEWFPVQWWEQTKKTQGARNWSALYQQRPAPEEGSFFKREWIRWYDEKPAHLRIYGASDYAVTADGGDYTVHGVAGVDPDDNIYLLDWWREQTDSLVWVESLIELIKVHKPFEWGEESGQIAKGMGSLIDKRQRETGAFCFRSQYTSAHDKPTRAQAFRGRMAQGKVYFPKDKPWVEPLISELLTFPAGRYDDQVDVCGLFGRMIAKMIGADVPKEQQEPRYNRTFNELRQLVTKRNRENE